MSKIAFTVLAVVAVVAIMGTSMISADAAGKPVKTISEDDKFFENQEVCNTISTLEVHRIKTLVVDADGEQFKFSIDFKGQFIEDDTDEVIGTYKAKTLEVGAFNADGTFTSKINIHVNCLNGQPSENIQSGYTVTRDGEFHNHGPQ